MVLDHIAYDARAVVVAGAVPYVDLLRHGNLDVVDVVSVPDRLEDGIGKAKDEQVLDRFLAQVVVDSEDLRLVEVALEGAI